MPNVIMAVLLVVGIVGIGLSYSRSTQTPKYRPVRGAHLPPLYLAAIAFVGAFFYNIGRAVSTHPGIADMVGGGLAVFCGAATIILLRFEPMAYFRGQR